MIQPGRKYEAESGYRYGFNGKENDNEVKGEGNQQDYGMRIYDPRLGRFLSVDPLMKSYPYYTPYQFASNTPILCIDVDGLESDKKVNENEGKNSNKSGAMFGLSIPRNLSNDQVVDAMRLAITELKSTLKNATGPDRYRATQTLYSNIVDYGQKNDLSIGAYSEFQSAVENYYNGLTWVAFNNPADIEKMESSILNNQNLSSGRKVITTTQGIVELGYRGKYILSEGQKLAMSLGFAAAFEGLALKQGLQTPRLPNVNSSNLQQAIVNLESKDIALGVREKLPAFAKTVGGQTWKKWGSTNFVTQFDEVINDPSRRIHFNLDAADGSRINVWQAVTEGAHGYQSSRATSWELYQLYINPGAQSRATFYYNGAVVPNPFKE